MVRLIATIGIHGAASTWAYNVVREMMIASFGEAQVRATYADVLAHLSDDERALALPNLIVKSHHGSEELDSWFEDNGAYRIISVRDPRDAAISMAQRFGVPLEATVGWVRNDCARVLRVMNADALVLRYEDRPFDSSAVVRTIAGKLELATHDGAIDEIFERYTPESVRDFARKLDTLPEGRLTKVSAFKMDQVTKILEVHIGDTRSGKWRDLPAAGPAEITRSFGSYLGALGYAA